MPPTGEQPAQDRPVSHSSTVTFSLVGAIILVIAAGVAGYTRLQANVEHMDGELLELRAKAAAASVEVTNQDRRLQRVEDNYVRILEVLAEMKTDIRSIRSSGPAPARGVRGPP
jgi:hypothetical protein